MDNNKKLCEDIIIENFFGLSYTGQIKFFNFCSEILENYGTEDDYKYFNDVFSKYIKVISKFCEFKTNFSSYDVETINKLRKRVDLIKSNINLDDQFKNQNDDYYIDCYEDIQMYYPNSFSDSFVDNSINELYSRSRGYLVLKSLKLADYYSKIKDMDFLSRLRLCNGNRDLFNPDMKKISKDFYSLYYSMDTVERMVYIWHLSFYDSLFIDDKYEYDDAMEFVNCFSKEKNFVPVLARDYIRPGANIKVLSKYFKLDD